MALERAVQGAWKWEGLGFVGQVPGQPDWADCLERQWLSVVPVTLEVG